MLADHYRENKIERNVTCKILHPEIENAIMLYYLRIKVDMVNEGLINDDEHRRRQRDYYHRRNHKKDDHDEDHDDESDQHYSDNLDNDNEYLPLKSAPSTPSKRKRDV
jgi:hypothetical protein